MTERKRLKDERAGSRKKAGLQTEREKRAQVKREICTRLWCFSRRREAKAGAEVVLKAQAVFLAISTSYFHSRRQYAWTTFIRGESQPMAVYSYSVDCVAFSLS